MAIAVHTKLCNRKEVAVLAGACVHTILYSTPPESAVQYVVISMRRILYHKIAVYALLWSACCLYLSSSQAHCKGTETASVTHSPRITLSRTKQNSESSKLLCYAYGVSSSKESKSQANNACQRQNPRRPRKPKMGASAAKCFRPHKM